jgi:hypothetical protein
MFLAFNWTAISHKLFCGRDPHGKAALDRHFFRVRSTMSNRKRTGCFLRHTLRILFLAGNVMASPFTWSFTVAAQSNTLSVNAGGPITTNAESTVTFAGSASGGRAPYTYSWNFGDGTTSAQTAATLVNIDTTTQGNWSGTYGAAGYNVIGSTSSYPAYASVTRMGGGQFVWGNTTDVRGLLTPDGSTRVAGCWYGGTSGYTVDVTLSDGQTHPISLYVCDWDSTDRAEQVQVLDGANGAVLDTQNINNFHNGEYLT